MHTEVGGSNVPAFLTKLWKLVGDPDYDHLISWGASGKSFIIRNQARFAKELLPLYFKHNNMASFIRQLNMYGFRKIANIENSGLRPDKDEIEFYHSCFIKGQENLLEFIKRKVRNENSISMVNPKTVNPDEKIKKEEVKSILMDMKGIKGKQDSIDSFLGNLQRENEALWREVALLRQKHQKQQQIVEKLIQFFLTLVHNRGIGMKRNFPLMIDAKNGGSSNMNMVPNERSGPVIHDVTDNLLEEDPIAPSPLLTVPTGNNGPGSSGGSNSNSSVRTSNPFVDENSKSPFSTGGCDLGDPDMTKPSVVGFDSLEQDFSGINDPTSTADDLMSNINIPDNLDQLAANQQTELLSLEQPLEDNASLIEEQVSDQVDDGTKINPWDPLQLQTTSSALCKPSQSNTSLVPSSSSVLNTPTYTLENIEDQMEGIETQLSWLQEQMSIGTMNLDANTLLGVGLDNKYFDKLFCSEDDQPGNGNKQLSNDICANQMIQYEPRALPETGTPATSSSNVSNAVTSSASLNVSTDGGSSIYSPVNFDLPSLMPGNDHQSGVLFDQPLVTSPSPIGRSVPTSSSSVNLLGGELNSKDDLGKQLEELDADELFDAAELLNSETDLESLLQTKPQQIGSERKRRRVI